MVGKIDKVSKIDNLDKIDKVSIFTKDTSGKKVELQLAQIILQQERIIAEIALWQSCIAGFNGNRALTKLVFEEFPSNTFAIDTAKYVQVSFLRKDRLLSLNYIAMTGTCITVKDKFTLFLRKKKRQTKHPSRQGGVEQTQRQDPIRCEKIEELYKKNPAHKKMRQCLKDLWKYYYEELMQFKVAIEGTKQASDLTEILKKIVESTRAKIALCGLYFAWLAKDKKAMQEILQMSGDLRNYAYKEDPIGAKTSECKEMLTAVLPASKCSVVIYTHVSERKETVQTQVQRMLERKSEGLSVTPVEKKQGAVAECRKILRRKICDLQKMEEARSWLLQQIKTKKRQSRHPKATNPLLIC